MRVAGKITTAMRVLRTQGIGGTANILKQRVSSHRTEETLPQVNRRGGGIVGLVDVGSVGGLSSEWRRHAGKIRFLLNFEPRDVPLVTDNIVTMNTALWSENCTRDFYIYKGLKGSGSSLFMQNYDYVRQNWDTLKRRGPVELAETWFDRSEWVRTEQLTCRTLDQVIQESAPDVSFHFIKIDAQGAEYEILRGAEQLLAGSCVGLYLELFVLPLYKGIRLLPEMERYLAERGFRLVKKFPPHGTFDSQHDCLFMREGVDNPAVQIIREVYAL
jgi:FkbM family methyltransferase